MGKIICYKRLKGYYYEPFLHKKQIVGYTKKESEKRDKTIANKRYRRLVKVRIAKRSEVLPLVREVSNVWTFDKDGKHYYSEMSKLEMRK